jgi:hypothetical protein
MNNQYQHQSWQQPYLPNTQPTQPISATGQGPIPQSHQYPGSGPQTQAATYTSNSTTTTQQQTTTTSSNLLNNVYIPAYQQSVSPNPQYPDQSQNLVYQQQVVSQWPNESQQYMVPQPSPAPAPQQVPPQYQQQQQVVQSSPQPPLITQDLPQYQQQPTLKYPQPQVSSQPPLLDFQHPAKVDFSQLTQALPGPQKSTSNDFSQLMRAAPPTNATSSVVTTTTTHSKKTETYSGTNAGGKARKQVESKGDKEVQRFESKVQKLIKDIGVCPTGRSWYNSFEGYMCGEGIHFLYHKDIDKAFKQPGWLPQVTWVNTWGNPEAQNSGLVYSMHPPQVVFDQPMHRVHAESFRSAKMMGSVQDIESKEKAKLQGCTAECFRGATWVSREQMKRDSRARGFDPNATRHAMFN